MHTITPLFLIECPELRGVVAIVVQYPAVSRVNVPKWEGVGISWIISDIPGANRLIGNFHVRLSQTLVLGADVCPLANLVRIINYLYF